LATGNCRFPAVCSEGWTHFSPSTAPWSGPSACHRTETAYRWTDLLETTTRCLQVHLIPFRRSVCKWSAPLKSLSILSAPELWRVSFPALLPHGSRSEVPALNAFHCPTICWPDWNLCKTHLWTPLALSLHLQYLSLPAVVCRDTGIPCSAHHSMIFCPLFRHSSTRCVHTDSWLLMVYLLKLSLHISPQKDLRLYVGTVYYTESTRQCTIFYYISLLCTFARCGGIGHLLTSRYLCLSNKGVLLLTKIFQNSLQCFCSAQGIQYK
jgi:hypothetical protein